MLKVVLHEANLSCNLQRKFGWKRHCRFVFLLDIWSCCATISVIIVQTRSATGGDFSSAWCTECRVWSAGCTVWFASADCGLRSVGCKVWISECVVRSCGVWGAEGGVVECGVVGCRLWRVEYKDRVRSMKYWFVMDYGRQKFKDKTIIDLNCWVWQSGLVWV